MSSLEIFGGLGVLIAGLIGWIKIQSNQKKRLKRELGAQKIKSKVDKSVMKEVDRINKETGGEFDNKVKDAKSLGDLFAVANDIFDRVRTDNDNND